MQVCFLGLQAFSTLCQSVDFVNILKAPEGAFLDHSGSLQTSTHSPPVLLCNSSQVSFTALLALPAAG